MGSGAEGKAKVVVAPIIPTMTSTVPLKARLTWRDQKTTSRDKHHIFANAEESKQVRFEHYPKKRLTKRSLTDQVA